MPSRRLLPTDDPQALPSIESITRYTDMGQFLQSGAPVELVRDALRAAWVADPAVRNFIGVAEAQWDFNDPGLPGFGPLHARDVAACLAARAKPRPEGRELAPQAPTATPPVSVVDSVPIAEQPAPFGVAPLAPQAQQGLPAPAESIPRPGHHGSALPT